MFETNNVRYHKTIQQERVCLIKTVFTLTISMKSGLRNVSTLNDSETLLGREANELSAGFGSMFIVAKTPWY